MARKPDPKSKAGFVRSFASSTPAAEIVTKAKAKGIKLTPNYVHKVRGSAKKKRKAARAKATVAVPVSTTAAVTASSSNGSSANGGGLEAEIERIVEAKVTALLRARLGSLFGAP